MDFNEICILITYFFIYSFLGWVLESVFKTILQKKFVNSGFVNGPFCPIYGFGALILYMFLDGFKNNFVLVFVVGVFVFSVWEYLVGYFLEKIFNTKYWDYSDERFNCQGRICLRMSLVWGLLGVVFTYILHPAVTNLVDKVPIDMLKPILAILSIALTVDTVVSAIKVRNMEVGLSKLKEIQLSLNSKLAELKSLQGMKALATKKIQLDSLKNTVEELKETERLLKYKINKRIVRLRKAFPTMKSQLITDFLNQRIEVIKKEKKER